MPLLCQEEEEYPPPPGPLHYAGALIIYFDIPTWHSSALTRHNRAFLLHQPPSSPSEPGRSPLPHPASLVLPVSVMLPMNPL